MQKLLHFPQGPCPIGGFEQKYEKTFTTRLNLEKHLISAFYGISAENAKEKADKVASTFYVLVPDFEKTGADRTEVPKHNAPIDLDEYEEDDSLFV